MGCFLRVDLEIKLLEVEVSTHTFNIGCFPTDICVLFIHFFVLNQVVSPALQKF